LIIFLAAILKQQKEKEEQEAKELEEAKAREQGLTAENVEEIPEPVQEEVVTVRFF
jgi:hypothetical protein